MMDGARSEGHRSDANGAAGGAAGSRFADFATLSLLRRVFESFTAMARDESALLKAELRDTVKSYVGAAVAGVVALVAAGALVNFLGLAAVGGLLAAGLPLWGAALVCAAALAVIAVAAVFYAIGKVRSADPLPRRTINNVRRDFQAMRDALRQEGH